MAAASVHAMRWTFGPFHGYCDNPSVCLLLAVAVVVLLVGLGLILAGMRSGWVGMAAYREVRRLPRGAWPPPLQSAAARARVRGVICLDLAEPTAFCAGLLRPKIFISAGAVASLDSEQLDGVLLHEADHARRYEPLRRSLRQSLSISFFYLPVIRWWANYQLERAELRADRHALERVGPKALAGALVATDWPASMRPVTAFSAAGEARVAQILGDPVPMRRPPPWIWALSGGGLAGAVWLTHCVAGGLFVG